MISIIRLSEDIKCVFICHIKRINKFNVTGMSRTKAPSVGGPTALRSFRDRTLALLLKTQVLNRSATPACENTESELILSLVLANQLKFLYFWTGKRYIKETNFEDLISRYLPRLSTCQSRVNLPWLPNFHRCLPTTIFSTWHTCLSTLIVYLPCACLPTISAYLSQLSIRCTYLPITSVYLSAT